jgi:hypothetical protein
MEKIRKPNNPFSSLEMRSKVSPDYQTRPNHILILPILEANVGMGSPTLLKILGRARSSLHIGRLAQPKEIKVSDKEIQQSLEEARQKGRDKVITIKST